jgi:hypothetical protein
MKDKIYRILDNNLIGTYEIKQQCAEEILQLFNISKRSSCCNALIDTDEQSCVICSNCGERL